MDFPAIQPTPSLTCQGGDHLEGRISMTLWVCCTQKETQNSQNFATKQLGCHFSQKKKWRSVRGGHTWIKVPTKEHKKTAGASEHGIWWSGLSVVETFPPLGIQLFRWCLCSNATALRTWKPSWGSAFGTEFWVVGLGEFWGGRNGIFWIDVYPPWIFV